MLDGATYGKRGSGGTALQIRDDALSASVTRRNPPDDYKGAGGDFYVQVTKLFSLSRPGKTFHSFMLASFAPLITPDTTVYKQLEKDIFGACCIS